MTQTTATVLSPMDVDEASEPVTGGLPLTRLAEAHSLEVEWLRARDRWLAVQRTKNTRRAYRIALDDFFHATGAAPWLVGESEVSDWIALMRAARRSEATIKQKLAACSSFYRFVCARYTPANRGDHVVPLCQFNPFLAIERPKLPAYSKASCLSADQAGALLAAIPSDTLQGHRDYALFLTYLSTGRRNSEVRLLKWGDLVELQGTVHCRWNRTGACSSTGLPGEMWTAIQVYLLAAGRMAMMGQGDYIFTALTDRAARLKNVDAATWNPTAQPLSSREIGRLLKRYARLAGLDAMQICVSTLRRTAAHLRREAGDEVETICDFLNLSSINATRRYLARFQGEVGDTWTRVADMLHLDRLQERRAPRPAPKLPNPKPRRGRYVYGRQP